MNTVYPIIRPNKTKYPVNLYESEVFGLRDLFSFLSLRIFIAYDLLIRISRISLMI